MLKSLTRFCCLIALLGLLTACNLDGKPSIAVVDLAKVQASSQLMVKVSKHLEEYRNALMVKAQEAENTFKKDENEETRKAYLAAVDGFETAMKAEEKRIFTALSDGVDSTLTQYRKEHGYLVILVKDTVLSYDDSLDVTEDVTKALDTLELDFAGTNTPAQTDEQPAEQSEQKPEASE